MKALTYFEMDVDFCALRYGTTNGAGTCPAVLGVDSADKCFNTLATCPVRNSFINEPVTLRFARPAPYLPADVEASPLITDISYSPAVVSLGEDLGERSSLSVTLADQPHSDTGPGGDKYLADRDYDPFKQGTRWGKFKARQPFVRGRPARLVQGLLGDALADMESRHFLMEGFTGPTLDGKLTVTSKDALKLADGDRAQAPLLSPGSLVSGISDSDTTLTLTPTDIGAEYPWSGYLAIGGSEIVSFLHDPTAGADGNCQLLLHGDGTDGSTTVTDSSTSHRTVTVNGNLQLDTVWKKFGTASLLFDGTGDYGTVPDSSSWPNGTADFTLDLWVKPSALAATMVLLSQNSSGTTYWSFYVTSDGALHFSVLSAGVTLLQLDSAAGALVVSGEDHVAVERYGNVFTLFVGGVAVATATAAISIPNMTNNLVIGAFGTGTVAYAGWMDEVRVSVVARYQGAAFELPGSAYQASKDTCVITRGQYNTASASHSAGEGCQICLAYSAQDPADVVADLFETYAGVDPAMIPIENWRAETAANYGGVISALIAAPEAVSTLLSEIIQQVGLAIWDDDLAGQIQLRVLSPIATDAETFDDIPASQGGHSNIIEGSLTIQEQPDKRVSRVWVWYGQRNPLKGLDKDNFRCPFEAVDLDSEEDWGQPAFKIIYSRWIPFGGQAAAQRIADVLISRFKTPPRRFTFSLFRHGSETPELGEGCRLEALPLQDQFGARASVPIQLVRINPGDATYEIEAEEQLFADLVPVDPLTDVITIAQSTYNVDLRALHDQLYPAAQSGDTVICEIYEGVVVGALRTTDPAFLVDNGWAAGVTIIVKNRGRIQGRGAHGGSYGPGGDGGTALKVQRAIQLFLDEGDAEIFGGAGAGGAFQTFYKKLGGGGGAGTRIGDGGAGTDGNGSPGTADHGGNGAHDGGDSAGDGGDPGEDGADSTYPGGAAGLAIDGVSNCTITGTGDVRGVTSG